MREQGRITSDNNISLPESAMRMSMRKKISDQTCAVGRMDKACGMTI